MSNLGPCVLWEGSVRGKGYGQVWDSKRRKQIGAHVKAWEDANGMAVPPGMCVMHRCDVRLCVRPSHLKLGTVGDNNRDMRDKGRQRTGWEKRVRNEKGQFI